jgi:hypothetical protein
MKDQRSDVYHALRQRISAWLARGGGTHTWSEYILLAPDVVHLLCKLTLDPDVSMKEKARLAATIAYFVSPPRSVA